MKKLLLLFSFVLSAHRVFAANDTTRVLFIGNSFTAVEDVPGLVKSLAEQAGHPFEMMAHTPGGISVGDVSQGTSAHMNNPAVFAAIRSKKWDFVVLQDNQGRFVDGAGIFPSPNASKVVEGHLKIRDSVRANWPCARMLWFSGWAWKDGYPGLGDGAKLIRNIYENYLVLNDTTNEIIVPIGSAWLRSMQQLQNVDLWSPDLAHQSLEGSYLAASTIYSSIFRSSPENVLFSGGVDTTVARTMRKIGFAAVTDSFVNSGLSAFTPTLTQNGNQLVATAGAASYEWYKNGTLLTGNTNTIAITGTGTYQVVVKSSASCKSRSLEKTFTATTAIATMATINNVQVYPNPVNDQLMIKSGDNGAMHITITNSMGGIVVDEEARQQAVIPFSQLSAGVYFISVANEKGRYTTRIVKQ